VPLTRDLFGAAVDPDDILIRCVNAKKHLSSLRKLLTRLYGACKVHRHCSSFTNKILFLKFKSDLSLNSILFSKKFVGNALLTSSFHYQLFIIIIIIIIIITIIIITTTIIICFPVSKKSCHSTLKYYRTWNQICFTDTSQITELAVRSHEFRRSRMNSLPASFMHNRSHPNPPESICTNTG